MSTNDYKFLICSSKPERLEAYSEIIRKFLPSATIYSASEGFDALFKIENAPPQVLICDEDLSKLSGIQVSQKLLQSKKHNKIAIIIASKIPDQEHFVDQVVIGQVQFLTKASDENLFHRCIARALNYLSVGETTAYRLRYLGPQETLFFEGEPGDAAFIVKKGELEAIRNNQPIGRIKNGEFVGEMSHFNNEPRSATIRATEPSELIEIPFGSLDTVLFSKPAWSKALVMTLSRRLKSSLSS